MIPVMNSSHSYIDELCAIASTVSKNVTVRVDIPVMRYIPQQLQLANAALDL